MLEKALLRFISPKILTIFTVLVFNTDNYATAKNNILQKSNSTPTSIHTNNKDTDNIYKFLLADIAIYRNQPEIAILNLQQLLLDTKNAQIAQILTEYAIELEDYKLSVFAAQTWAELAPKNFKAQIIAATMLLEDNPTLVEKFIKQAIIADPAQVDAQLSSLLAKLLDHHKKLVLQILQNLANKTPNDPITQLCLAQVAAQLNNIDVANIATDNALKLKADLTHAIFLKAKIIRANSKSDLSALAYLKKKLAIFPKNEELKLFYAAALLDNNQTKLALTLLKSLLLSKNQLYASEAKLLIAEIYLQKEYLNLDIAKKYLNNLINENFAVNKAAFLLGQIAEQQHDDATAIDWYTVVNQDPYHIFSYLRAATLLANNQQLLEAIEILNRAMPNTKLEKKQLLLFKIELALSIKDLQIAMLNVNEGLSMAPNDIDFLYAHSIISGLDNQIEAAEQDLKKILSLQPDNHSVLNALGYLLASHTNRTKEALDYLQKALYLSPDNPSYMDSMGYLLYRMGMINDSLKLLYKAYTINNDAAIANHLGEVLWVNGQKQQAKDIWRKAWQTNPNNLELLDTLKQYKINFSTKLQ